MPIDRHARFGFQIQKSQSSEEMTKSQDIVLLWIKEWFMPFSPLFPIEMERNDFIM